MAEEKEIPCKIGFFLHIPFPSWDIIRIFPWHDLILQGILGCDLVIFGLDVVLDAARLWARADAAVRRRGDCTDVLLACAHSPRLRGAKATAT